MGSPRTLETARPATPAPKTRTGNNLPAKQPAFPVMTTSISGRARITSRVRRLKEHVSAAIYPKDRSLGAPLLERTPSPVGPPNFRGSVSTFYILKVPSLDTIQS